MPGFIVRNPQKEICYKILTMSVVYLPVCYMLKNKVVGYSTVFFIATA